MVRWLNIVIFSFILLLIFTAVAWAETTPAKVSADEIQYDYESKQVEATGNVKIEYKKVKIEADYALIDQEQDILLAIGSVVVHNKNDICRGERFLYYLKTEQGMISPLNSIITDPEIKGPTYLTANEAFIKGEEIHSKHAIFTSCNLAHPHYHFTGKEVEYYPGDYILMRHVWYWEGPVPIFYLPVLYISLKNDNFEVKVGKSYAEGWFIDAKYYYYRIPDQYSWGAIHTRLTEYGGNFYELENTRYTSHTGTFTQRYGFLDKHNMTNPDVAGYYNGNYTPLNNDFMAGLKYNENINSKVKTSQTLTNWHRFSKDGISYIDNTYNLVIDGENPYPDLTLDFSDLNLRTYRKVNLNTNWNYNPDETSSIYLNGQWYYNGYVDENNPNVNRLYTFKTSKNWGWSNIHLTLSENVNYNNTQSSSSSIFPDVVYTIPHWEWPVVNDMEVKGQYTHLDKFNSSKKPNEGERYALNVTKNPVELWQKDRITIDTQSDFKYRDFLVNKYETELYVLSSQVGLRDQFTKEFYTKFDVGYAETSGLNNDYFGYEGDNSLPGAFLKNGWFYNSDTFKASLKTEYNFKSQYAYPVDIMADWIPEPRAEVYFDTSYDWYKGLGLTNFRVSYNPKQNWRLSLMLGYNFQNINYPWTMKQFEAMISDRINSKWSYQIATRYDYLMNDFSVSQYALIYDWHCREVMFHYDGIQREYWVQIFIKAFPGAKLRVTNINTMENLVNDFMAE